MLFLFASRAQQPRSWCGPGRGTVRRASGFLRGEPFPRPTCLPQETPGPALLGHGEREGGSGLFVPSTKIKLLSKSSALVFFLGGWGLSKTQDFSSPSLGPVHDFRAHKLPWGA